MYAQYANSGWPTVAQQTTGWHQLITVVRILNDVRASPPPRCFWRRQYIVVCADDLSTWIFLAFSLCFPRSLGRTHVQLATSDATTTSLKIYIWRGVGTEQACKVSSSILFLVFLLWVNIGKTSCYSLFDICPNESEAPTEGAQANKKHTTRPTAYLAYTFNLVESTIYYQCCKSLHFKTTCFAVDSRLFEENNFFSFKNWAK